MTQCEMYVCLRVKRVKCEPHRTGMGSMIYTIDSTRVTWISFSKKKSRYNATRVSPPRPPPTPSLPDTPLINQSKK